MGKLPTQTPFEEIVTASDIGVIVGGIVGAVLVILIIYIILRRSGYQS